MEALVAITLGAGQTRKALAASPADRDQARAVLDRSRKASPRLVLALAGEETPLPAELSAILETVVESVAVGGSVSVSVMPAELTTTMAASLLGISRPTLMKMISREEIPARLVGTHHRLAVRDVLEAKRSRLEAQRQAFEELRELEAQLNQA
jgi:excisionase family DNA binding protein